MLRKLRPRSAYDVIALLALFIAMTEHAGQVTLGVRQDAKLHRSSSATACAARPSRRSTWRRTGQTSCSRCARPARGGS